MVFTSNDKLHANIVPFFLRENQTFILGRDLKADLAKLDKYYDSFPDDVKKRGVMSFAVYPPNDSSFLTARLWDKHMSSAWREQNPNFTPSGDSKLGKMIQEEMQQLEKASPIADESRFSGDQADTMIIKRMVLPHKGKWTLLPPEVLNSNKNKKDSSA
jgi:hypothetical protein